MDARTRGPFLSYQRWRIVRVSKRDAHAIVEAGKMHHTITRMPLAELKPAAYNPRRISDAALGGLAHSIERFGCVQPIIWNRPTKRVVGGHQRLRVLLDRGEAEADVVVVDLSAAEEKALNVALM